MKAQNANSRYKKLPRNYSLWAVRLAWLVIFGGQNAVHEIGNIFIAAARWRSL